MGWVGFWGRAAAPPQPLPLCQGYYRMQPLDCRAVKPNNIINNPKSKILCIPLLKIIQIVALEDPRAAVAHLDDALREGAQERSVVRHSSHRALEGVER